MKRSSWVRLLTIALIGAVGGLWLRYRFIQTTSLGRAAYLADESARFDRIGRPHSLIAAVLAGIVVAGAILGVYELLVFIVSKLLPKDANDDSGLGS